MYAKYLQPGLTIQVRRPPQVHGAVPGKIGEAEPGRVSGHLGCLVARKRPAVIDAREPPIWFNDDGAPRLLNLGSPKATRCPLRLVLNPVAKKLVSPYHMVATKKSGISAVVPVVASPGCHRCSVGPHSRPEAARGSTGDVRSCRDRALRPAPPTALLRSRPL